MQKEPSFAVGDAVEVLTGDYELMCGDRVYSRDATEGLYGNYQVVDVEYEMGEYAYHLADANGHTVSYVAENDLRRV